MHLQFATFSDICISQALHCVKFISHWHQGHVHPFFHQSAELQMCTPNGFHICLHVCIKSKLYISCKFTHKAHMILSKPVQHIHRNWANAPCNSLNSPVDIALSSAHHSRAIQHKVTQQGLLWGCIGPPQPHYPHKVAQEDLL